MFYGGSNCRNALRCFRVGRLMDSGVIAGTGLRRQLPDHPRSSGQASRPMQAPSDGSSVQGPRQSQEAEVHNMSPDPWLSQPDPWTEWHHSREAPSAPEMPAVYYNPFTHVQSAIPPLSGPHVRPTQPVDAFSWQAPGVGQVGSRQSFSAMLGLSAGSEAGNAPLSNTPTALAPGWFAEVQRQLSTVHEESSVHRTHRTEPSQPSASRAAHQEQAHCLLP